MGLIKLILVLLVILALNSCGENAGYEEVPQPLEVVWSTEDNGEPAYGDVISTFGTPIVDKKKARVSNIEIANKSINGTIVYPGETFSFNFIVGKRTPARGYKKAYMFVGKEKKMGWGGGICQVSTTLYNAALGAGLDVTERHGHEIDVTYIELGRDATVSYGEQDLKFVNNLSYPIEILPYIKEDNEYFEVVDIIRR